MMDSDAFKVTGIDPAQEEAKAKKCRRLILLTLLENEHTHVKIENAQGDCVLEGVWPPVNRRLIVGRDSRHRRDDIFAEGLVHWLISVATTTLPYSLLKRRWGHEISTA